MGKLLVFSAGLVTGAALVHVVARTPAGARAVGVLNATTDEFLRALSDSYRARLEEGR